MEVVYHGGLRKIRIWEFCEDTIAPLSLREIVTPRLGGSTGFFVHIKVNHTGVRSYCDLLGRTYGEYCGRESLA
jgi:hypothetical protein